MSVCAFVLSYCMQVAAPGRQSFVSIISAYYTTSSVPSLNDTASLVVSLYYRGPAGYFVIALYRNAWQGTAPFGAQAWKSMSADKMYVYLGPDGSGQRTFIMRGIRFKDLGTQYSQINVLNAFADLTLLPDPYALPEIKVR